MLLQLIDVTSLLFLITGKFLPENRNQYHWCGRKYELFCVSLLFCNYTTIS